jgi:hypothetical protein
LLFLVIKSHLHPLTALMLFALHNRSLVSCSSWLPRATRTRICCFSHFMTAHCLFLFFLTKGHPHPHRLKVFLQLEGKNLGIVLPDADLDVAVREITTGTTNYNGQRCT